MSGIFRGGIVPWLANHFLGNSMTLPRGEITCDMSRDVDAGLVSGRAVARGPDSVAAGCCAIGDDVTGGEAGFAGSRAAAA